MDCDFDWLDIVEPDPEDSSYVAYDKENISTIYGNTKDYRVLTKPEVAELIERSRDENFPLHKHCKYLLFRHNLNLIPYTAKIYGLFGLGEQDMYQEGVFGLEKAIEKFKPELGFAFSTYAIIWIRQVLTRAIKNKHFIVRYPCHTYDLWRQVQKFINDYRNENGGENPPYRLLEDMFETEAGTLKAIFHKPYTAEIDYDQFDHNSDSHVFEECEFRQMSESINDSLDILTPKERDIIEKRYGLIDNNPLTLEAIAQTHTLTRERIRQIEVKALRKLKRKHENLKEWLSK